MLVCKLSIVYIASYIASVCSDTLAIEQNNELALAIQMIVNYI